MIASLVDPLVDLVLPRSCAGCDRPGSGWCEACRGPLRLCSAAVAGLPVVAATGYAGPSRRVMLAYKERGRRDLAAPLAAVLAAAVRAVLSVCGLRPSESVLVCVPSTRAAVARRGGDHVARLALRAGRATGVRVVPGVLSLVHEVRDSAGLSVTERSHNLAGAMRARACPSRSRAGHRGRQVVLVDDIVTSGATLREARRALLAGGWPVAGAAAFAATPLSAGGRTTGAGVVWQPVPPRPVLARPLAPPRSRV